MQQALSKVLVLIAVILACQPVASDSDSCSLEVCAASLSSGSSVPSTSFPDCVDSGDTSDVEDGASLLQLSEKVARRAVPGAHVPALQKEARAAVPEDWASQGVRNLTARPEAGHTQIPAAHAGPLAARVPQIWLQQTQRVRQTSANTKESLIGRGSANTRSGIVIITLVAFALATLAVVVLFCRMNEEQKHPQENFAPTSYQDRVGPQQPLYRNRTESAYADEARMGSSHPIGSGHLPPPSDDFPQQSNFGQAQGVRNSPARPESLPRGASLGGQPRQNASGSSPGSGATMVPVDPTGAPGMAPSRAPVPHAVDYRAASRTQSAPQGPSPKPVVLCGELPGVIIPEGKIKFIAKVPALFQEQPRAMTKKCHVVTQGGEKMFMMKLDNHAHHSSHGDTEEIVSIYLEDKEEAELAMLSFGHPPGAPGIQCEIFKCKPHAHHDETGEVDPDDVDFFGKILQDSPSGSTYTLMLPPKEKALTVTVSGGSSADRQVRFTTGSIDIASAQLKGNEYEVSCFPRADVVLVVLLLSAVDRFTAHGDWKTTL